MCDFVEIPASAWEGVSDPKGQLHKRCFSCGGTNVRDLSMAEMFAVPNAINAHTYMIPGKAWGYLQCDDCERALPTKAPKAPWWKFW